MKQKIVISFRRARDYILKHWNDALLLLASLLLSILISVFLVELAIALTAYQAGSMLEDVVSAASGQTLHPALKISIGILGGALGFLLVVHIAEFAVVAITALLFDFLVSCRKRWLQSRAIFCFA